MKKGILLLLLTAAVAATVWFFFARPDGLRPARDGGERALTDEPATHIPGEEGARVNPRPSGTEAGSEQPPEPEPASMIVRFETGAVPMLNMPSRVTLIVESNPKGWPAEVGEGARLDLLLRLPVGVKLASGEGWSPAQLPPEEKEDASGPWSVYEKQVPLQIKQGVPPERLAAEAVQLAVTEEGVNWIISARARLTQGSQTWQAFGVVFATLQGSDGQFHEIPKAPTDIRSAQAS